MRHKRLRTGARLRYLLVEAIGILPTEGLRLLQSEEKHSDF
jgi:hypothetical protein